jgi:hypothetical protein
VELLTGVFVPIAIGVLFHLARFAYWIWKIGDTIVIPWDNDATPPFAPLASRARTRVASRLAIREPDYCALIFMKRPKRCGPKRYRMDMLLFDVITGCTGVYSTAVDCSHEADHRPWIITSDALRTPYWRIDGPHFAPLAACAPSGFVAVDISSHIDAHELLADLRRSIQDHKIRHKGIAPFSYLFGRTPANRVTCSGFIGQAILRQESTPLAAALRCALRERFTYGEISPADLARAAAILRLAPKGAAEPIRKISVWEWLRRHCVANAELRRGQA